MREEATLSVPGCVTQLHNFTEPQCVHLTNDNRDAAMQGMLEVSQEVCKAAQAGRPQCTLSDGYEHP